MRTDPVAGVRKCEADAADLGFWNTSLTTCPGGECWDLL
jgi:hypothetical protein